MKISIIGYGHVGKAMHKLFSDAIIYDKYLNLGDIEEVNSTDISFICVPTPMRVNGECDIKEVEEVISWIKTKIIVIRSTVYVGFTEEMKKKYKKNLVFQPEYYGETINHPFANIRNQHWLSFGGDSADIHQVISAYQKVINSNIKINIYPSKEVEFAKYMENAFLATKVIFCNEMYDIAKRLNISFDISREVWISDPRIGSSHTFVYENDRGFGGSCLPKDIHALCYLAQQHNVDTTLLNAVINKNNFYRKKNNEK